MRKSKRNFNKWFTVRVATDIMVMLAFLLAIVAATLVATGPGRRSATYDNFETTVSVQAGDTLARLLSAQGITNSDIHQIAALLRSNHRIRSIRAGSDQLIFVRVAEEAPVHKIILAPSPFRQIQITHTDGAWTTQMVEMERDIRIVRKSGEIRHGDSFYVAGTRAGIPPGILADMFDLLAFEIDFERDVRAGQQFSVMYEEHFIEGERVRNGPVVKISFHARRGHVRMYRFRSPDGKVGYYDENGDGAVKTLKRTPINNARVTSSFGNRRHPVLGFTRAHRGVDFRAAHGTPIPAAGAGTVIVRRFCPSYGNFVRIRHGNGFETLYAHMSRFAPGVNVGTHVRQGQIIGFVGSTGVSTGPHLHYEIIRNGVHVNPMTVKLPAIENLSPANKKIFAEIRDKIDASYEVLSRHPDMFIQL
ncbi:MAG: peptidoglycan DD-metalloendopeptidase family protein [Alphaproteobacteria bacterium]|nr:peptidoglycan DD-metalloendopeptidase family protein [Alphaproteobacteria bacterium]